MNFLAHAWLADASAMDRLGGVMGDFVKGPLPAGLPPQLAEGVRLHRKIDVWADTHSAFQRSRSRLSAPRRRVSGIMVDMFYDHFLARYWAEFHTMPLEVFTARLYELMREHHAWLPPRLRRILPLMSGDDWLASYREVAAVEHALDRMSARLRRTDMLAGAGHELTAHYAALEGDFREFMPSAKAFVGRYLAARPTRVGAAPDNF